MKFFRQDDDNFDIRRITKDELIEYGNDVIKDMCRRQKTQLHNAHVKADELRQDHDLIGQELVDTRLNLKGVKAQLTTALAAANSYYTVMQQVDKALGCNGIIAPINFDKLPGRVASIKRGYDNIRKLSNRYRDERDSEQKRGDDNYAEAILNLAGRDEAETAIKALKAQEAERERNCKLWITKSHNLQNRVNDLEVENSKLVDANEMMKEDHTQMYDELEEANARVAKMITWLNDIQRALGVHTPNQANLAVHATSLKNANIELQARLDKVADGIWATKVSELNEELENVTQIANTRLNFLIAIERAMGSEIPAPSLAPAVRKLADEHHEMKKELQLAKTTIANVKKEVQ